MDEMNADSGLQISDSAGTVNPARGGFFRSLIRNPQSAIGYLLAVAGLIWVLHDVEFERLRSSFSHLNWRWIALAIACDILSYVCQGIRWQKLLKPIGDISTIRATQAIYVGLFTNEILPMRLGELARAYLVSRWSAANFLTVIPSMMVERVFDGFWLMVGIGLTALIVPLPKYLLRAADVLGIGLVIASLILFYLITRQTNRNSETGTGLLASLNEKLSKALKGMGKTRGFYLSLAWSMPLLMFQGLAFWLVMLGCGLHLPFWSGAAVFLIVHLGTAIPNAPANIGAYQFFTVVGLTLFGVDKSVATGFSMVVFLLLTAPLWVLGLIALSQSGTTLAKIRREVKLSGA